MSAAGKALVTGAVLLAAAIGRGAAAEAPPIRIGATYSKTGSLAAPGQNQRRGVELCVKHANQKGGVLGRRIELVVEDDQSSGATAAALYEKLITRDKVDAIFGPYSSPVTAGMADVTERHRMSLLALAAATSIFQQGRKYSFMVPSPAERYLEGLIDIAASHGLKTVAVLHEETLLQKSIARGVVELAKKRGLQVVLAEAYPKGTTDFGGMVRKVKTASPDVLAVATYDTVAITRLLKDLNINPKMFGATVDVALPEFYQAVGREGEFVYGPSAPAD
jgi:branched-chain amino acid transport system substrate-binding protein